MICSCNDIFFFLSLFSSSRFQTISLIHYHDKCRPSPIAVNFICMYHHLLKQILDTFSTFPLFLCTYSRFTKVENHVKILSKRCRYTSNPLLGHHQRINAKPIFHGVPTCTVLSIYYTSKHIFLRFVFSFVQLIHLNKGYQYLFSTIPFLCLVVCEKTKRDSLLGETKVKGFLQFRKRLLPL